MLLKIRMVKKIHLSELKDLLNKTLAIYLIKELKKIKEKHSIITINNKVNQTKLYHII